MAMYDLIVIQLAGYPWNVIQLNIDLSYRCEKVCQEIFGEGSACKPVLTFPQEDLDEDGLTRELLLIKDECNISGMS